MSEEIITELQSKNKHLSDLLANQYKEVERLRDLLKECKESVRLHSDIARGLEGRKSAAYQNLLNILTRIHTALGDNEIQANQVADIKIQES